MDNTATQSAPADTTRHNRIISELMDALDIILREAEKPECSRHYIIGAAKASMAQCDAQRVRNRDGYLVVKESR